MYVITGVAVLLPIVVTFSEGCMFAVTTVSVILSFSGVCCHCCICNLALNVITFSEGNMHFVTAVAVILS